MSTPSLPNWFGARDAPKRRISGTLFGDGVPLAGTVHLRIEVPDPTIWSGLERATSADGRFDFGEVRAGRYSVLATSPGRTSRLIAVDTTTTAAGAVELHAYPCRPSVRRILSESGQPVARAKIDIGGVVVATTDRHGRFTLCVSEQLLASREFNPITIRASGHAAGLAVVYRDSADIVLEDAVVVRGTITDESGAPVRDIAVRLAHASRPTSHSSYLPVPLQGVTNAEGKFEIRNVPEIYPFYFRLVMGQRTLTRRGSLAGRSLSNVELSMSEFVEDVERLPNARISGRVVHRGKPVPDVVVVVVHSVGADFEHRPTLTRSRMDGSFDLPVDTTGTVPLLVHRRRGQELRRNIEVAPGQHLRDLTFDLHEAEIENEIHKARTDRARARSAARATRAMELAKLVQRRSLANKEERVALDPLIVARWRESCELLSDEERRASEIDVVTSDLIDSVPSTVMLLRCDIAFTTDHRVLEYRDGRWH